MVVRVLLGNVQGKIVAAPLARGAGLVSSLTRSRGLMTIPAENMVNDIYSGGSRMLAGDRVGLFPPVGGG